MLRRVDLPASVAGSLWLSAMPGRFEPWPVALQAMRQQGVNRVLCLTPQDEMDRLSPAYRSAIDGHDLPFKWAHLPMENFGLPTDMAAFEQGIAEVVRALQGGEAVLLHCAAGIGRTGSAAACVVKRLGLTTQEALDRVREAGSNPENAIQSGLVQRF